MNLLTEKELLEKDATFVYKMGLTRYGKLIINRNIDTDMFITIGYINMNEKQFQELQEKYLLRGNSFDEDCKKIRDKMINNDQQIIKDMLDYVYGAKSPTTYFTLEATG